MGQLLGPDFPGDIALAVSGGGDSMAMLYLTHNWTHVYGLRLWVVTVDHGLRPEAAEEAAIVARECRSLGWPHTTLRWHWDGQGNVQDAARQARLRLIDRWRGGIAHVLMAHTRDDLAETFLMRLARGSGVEGLSAMATRRMLPLHGDDRPPLSPQDIIGARDMPGAGEAGLAKSMHILRPCLDMRREELRHYLHTLQGCWVEDPTNDDTSYDRVRMRRLLATLEAEGLGVERLAGTATRMARAKEALQARALSVWNETGREGETPRGPTGDIRFERAGFAATEQDTRMRLLAAALQFVSTSAYRPRAEATEALLDRLLSGGGGTLQGCEARAEGDWITVSREPAAVQGPVHIGESGALWDRRWKISTSEFNGLIMRALGEDGWAQCLPRPEDTPPYRTARALPSIWDGERLVACDAMDVGPGGTVALSPMGQPRRGFANFLLSH